MVAYRLLLSNEVVFICSRDGWRRYLVCDDVLVLDRLDVGVDIESCESVKCGVSSSKSL